MFVRDSNSSLKSYNNITLWKTLDQIQSVLSLVDSEMAELMKIQTGEFHNLKKRKIDPIVSAILLLSDAVNVGFETLVKGNLDYFALERQFKGIKSFLPTRYAEHANSKRRTAINLLNYIESTFGVQKRSQILKSFQMTESMFNDPDGLINLRFPIDICEWIRRFYKNDNLLIHMGKNSFHTNCNGQMGAILKQSRTITELFEKMFVELIPTYVEKNFSWSILSFKVDHCIIRGIPTQELRETVGEEYVNSRAACLARMGFVSSIPCYLGYPPVDVTQSDCVSQGAPHCTFQVNFTSLLTKSNDQERKLH